MPDALHTHHHPWLSTRGLVFLTIAMLFGLCATPGGALEAQDPTPKAGAETADSVAAPLTQDQLAEARREGRALGAKRGGWLGRAFVAGAFTLYLAPAIIVPVAAASEPSPPAEVRQQLLLRGPAYQQAFEAGYRREVRNKRIWTSAVGSVAGMGFTLLMIFTPWDN